MPLLKGEKNIGHNIKVEEEHGKPRKQAVAIALRTAGVPKKGKDATSGSVKVCKGCGRAYWPDAGDKGWCKPCQYVLPNLGKAKDEVLPVGGDRERAVALKKHELGLTKSQDKKATAKYVAGVWQARTPNQERLDKMRSTLERQGFAPDYAMDLENGSIAHIYRNPKTKAVMIIYEGRRGGHAVADSVAAEPVTGFEKGGGTATRNCAHCAYMAKGSGCDQPVMVKKSEQPRNAEGLPIVREHDVCKFFEGAGRAEDEMRRGGEVMPVGDEEQKIARWESKGGKYWVDLYFNPAFRLADGRTVVDAHYRGDSSGGSIQAGTAAEAINVMQKRIDRGGFQPDAAKNPMRRVKDELPVPIKTSSLVPMPTGEHNEVSYAAPRRANDAESAWRLLQAGRRLEERGLLKSASKTFSEAVGAAIEEKDEEARREATAAVARIRHKMAGTAATDATVPTKGIYIEFDNRRGQFFKLNSSSSDREIDAAAKKAGLWKKGALYPDFTIYVDGEEDSAGGGSNSGVMDSRTTAQDHSGSEPKDHLARAKQYEIGGDRARALDAYRAAASGYRRANDHAGEAEAREGIEACQAKFAQQYDHPGRGRAKVCDSEDAALRTALERTRAGEAVVVLGKTVRPGRVRDARELSVPEKHQLRIAKRTINMPDAMVGVMGGPSKSEAREIIKRLTGKESKDYYEEVNDAHEGFAKLEHSLAHEKGVHDPKAVAAAIGRKKYGAAGMARKAAAGRVKDTDSTAPLLEKARKRLRMAVAEKDEDTARAMRGEIARLQKLVKT